MSTPGHITITRSRCGPSTRVPRVMLITSFGSHVSSRVCASFAVLETVGQSLLSTHLHLDVRIQGIFGASLNFSPRSRWFACLTTILSSWFVLSESANPWCAQHGGLASDVSSGLDAGLNIQEGEYEGVCSVGAWLLSWWICWLAKLSLGTLRLVGRTPKQQREDPLLDLRTW